MKKKPQIPTYNEVLTAIAIDKRFEGFSNLSADNRKLIVNLALLKAITLINTSYKHTLDTAIDYWADIIKGNIDILADIEEELEKGTNYEI